MVRVQQSAFRKASQRSLGLKDEHTRGWWRAGEGHSGFTEQREQRGRTGNVQRNCKLRGDWPAGSHVAEEEAWVSEASGLH